MTIIAKKLMGGKTLNYLLAIAFVCGAFVAQAATTRYWKGGGSDTLWSTAGNWKDNGVPASGDSVHFRADQVSGGFSGKTVSMRNAYTAAVLHVSNGSNAEAPIVFDADQNPSHGVTFTDDGWLGYYADGALWLKSGTYTFKTSLRVGVNVNNNGSYKEDKYPFCLKVGDGSSTAVLNAKGTYDPILGKSSKLIADNATLDFTGKDFKTFSSSGAYITNSTMTANAIMLYGSSSMTASGSTITAKGGNPILDGSSKFIADNATLDFTGRYFNMYNTSSADIKDSELTAAILNVAVNENNNCKAVFNGGSLTLSATSKIGYGKNSKGYMYATNLTLNVTGNNALWLGAHDQSDATGVVDKKGGDWTIGGNLYIGKQSNDKGTFTADGGSVTVGGDTYIANGSGSTGTLTIKNGTFTTKSISATGTATLNMDGCTLKAGATDVNLIGSGITVKVGANGATIDTASCAVTIASDVGNASGATGAMMFAGGGTVTLSGVANWTGTTTVNAGTVLAFPAATKSALVTYGITVVIPAVGVGDGVTVLEINDGNGTFSAEDIAAITLTGNGNGRYALVLADEGAKVAISDTLAGEYVWNGGSSGDGWRTDGHWSKNNVAGDWYDSTAAVFESAGDAATVDVDVAAASVTFRADATVGGAATLTVPEVAVSSGVSAAINAPTAGALTKIGAGTLTLGASRTDATTLSEGTLVMSGSGTTLDWTKLTQGTDVAKPVTLKFDDGATIAETTMLNVGDQAGITASLVKEAGDWTVNKLHIGASDFSVASFYHNGGSLVVSGNLDIGQSASATSSYFEIAGGSVTNTGYYIHLGANSPGVMTVKTGGKYVALGTTGLIAGGSAAGTLNVAGGEVFLNNGPLNLSYRGGETAVNVTDGGTLTCTKMQHGAGGSGGATTITLDGGTICANADSTTFVPNKADITVKVGANGGTIDVNSKTITLLRPILEDAESTGGGMTFKGGGVVTLASGNTYTGPTTVEIGTTVHIPAPDDVVGTVNASVPETAPADGVYTLVAIDGEGTFTDAVLTGVAAPANAALRLSVDRKSVLCIYGNPPNTWVGGASGSLNDAGNWSLGFVPTDGESCVIGNVAAANLTNPSGSDFAPDIITFPADTALVTISGEGTLSGLASIVNNSTKHHVFNCKVICASDAPTLPMLASNYVSFPGGIEMTALSAFDNMLFYGNWHVKGGWNTNQKTATVKSGSSLVVDGLLNIPYGLTVESGAALTAADAEVHNADLYFLKQNSGTFTVTNEMRLVMVSDGSRKYHLGGLFNKGHANALTRVHGLVNSASTYKNACFPLNNLGDNEVNRIVMGEGGLSFRNCYGTNKNCYPYFVVESGKSVILESSADWNIPENAFNKEGSVSLELVGTLTVNTSDYDDPTLAHTVRAIGLIGNIGTLNVKGRGTFSVERTTSVTVNVQDTATLSVKPKCSVKNITVGETATLAVGGSGTATIDNGLTLKNGAMLAFNFTEKGVAPMLNVTDKTVTFDEGETTNVVVKISATEGKRPKSGLNVLTSGGKFADATVSLADGVPDWAKGVSVVDGEIVLDVKPAGTRIIVR